MNLLVKCPCCGNEFERTVKQVNVVVKRSGMWKCKKCSMVRMNKSRALPIGSKSVKRSGYIEIKTEDGWIREHIYIMQQSIHRDITSDEVVHHIDGNKANNSIDNLRLMSIGEHTTLHHTGVKRTDETRSKIGLKSSRYSMQQARMLRRLIDSGISQRKASFALGISQMAASRMARGITYKEHQ